MSKSKMMVVGYGKIGRRYKVGTGGVSLRAGTVRQDLLKGANTIPNRHTQSALVPC